MKKSIHVRAYIAPSAYPALVWLLVIFGSMLVNAWIGAKGLSFIGSVSAVAIVGMLIVDGFKKRLRNRGASVSDQGVSATIDGVATWTLPWTQYGGFCERESSERERIFHPERCGTEILNRQGVVVGLLNVEKSRHHYSNLRPGSFRALFWKILDARSTLDVKSPTARSFTTTTPKVALQTIIGVASLAISSSLFSSHRHMLHAVENDATVPMNPFYGLGGGILLMAGLTFLGIAFKGVTYLRFPKLYERLTKSRHDANLETPAPADGPRYEDFLIENGGAPDPVVLEEGIRYIYVDPEHRLADRPSLWPSIALVSIYPVICAIFFIVDPLQRPMLAVLGAATGAFVFLMIRLQKSLDSSARSMRDTIIPMEGGLTVIHQDGSHLTFSHRASRKVRSGINAPPNLKLEDWKEGRKRYLLDRTHLIKASVQLDHEELKDLEGPKS